MSLHPVLLRTTQTTTSSLGLSLTQATRRTFFSSSIKQLSPLHHQTSIPRIKTASQPTRSHPLLLTTTLAATSLTAYLATRPTSITYNDNSPASDFSSSAYSHGRDAKVPLSKDGGRSINPRAIRQISMGSLMGLGLGVVVSAFSKMIVLLGGVGIVVWQVCCSFPVFIARPLGA